VWQVTALLAECLPASGVYLCAIAGAGYYFLIFFFFESYTDVNLQQ
jgi:hypothetical protein